jgi:hypothetical protein
MLTYLENSMLQEQTDPPDSKCNRVGQALLEMKLD